MFETGSFIESVALLNAFFGTQVVSFFWAKEEKLNITKTDVK